MIKAFIFDMDGVIIDSEPLHFEVDELTGKRFGANLNKNENMARLHTGKVVQIVESVVQATHPTAKEGLLAHASFL